MLDLKYSLVIEATEDPEFLGFYSPDLEGVTGVGNSVEDCLYKAKWGMNEHIELLREHDLLVPSQTRHRLSSSATLSPHWRLHNSEWPSQNCRGSRVLSRAVLVTDYRPDAAPNKCRFNGNN